MILFLSSVRVTPIKKHYKSAIAKKGLYIGHQYDSFPPLKIEANKNISILECIKVDGRVFGMTETVKIMTETVETLADPMDAAAADAAELLKALSNPGRLRILCALVPGEVTVGELETMLGASQSYVSGQLLRLRNEGLVACERDGRSMRYRLSDPRVRPILERIYEIFCPEQ